MSAGAHVDVCPGRCVSDSCSEMMEWGTGRTDTAGERLPGRQETSAQHRYLPRTEGWVTLQPIICCTPPSSGVQIPKHLEQCMKPAKHSGGWIQNFHSQFRFLTWEGDEKINHWFDSWVGLGNIWIFIVYCLISVLILWGGFMLWNVTHICLLNK